MTETPMTATMHLPRVVTPEILDALSEHDPHAQRSRRDLQRINRVIASRHHVMRALRAHTVDHGSQHILELGAGDGTFMLRLAKQLHRVWPHARVTLLDQQYLLSAATDAALREIGWHVDVLHMDVMQWTAQPAPALRGVVIANLFMHHFNDTELRVLLRAIAQRTDRFVACEPRRSRLPLVASYLIGALGTNAVTRADAVTSVRAGFCGLELTALWPTDCGNWDLREYAAGAFSHCFVAQRTSE